MVFLTKNDGSKNTLKYQVIRTTVKFSTRVRDSTEEAEEDIKITPGTGRWHGKFYRKVPFLFHPEHVAQCLIHSKYYRVVSLKVRLSFVGVFVTVAALTSEHCLGA